MTEIRSQSDLPGPSSYSPTRSPISVDYQPELCAAGMPLSLRLVVAQSAKTLARAFDAALVLAGGSQSTWLILQAVSSGAGRTQTSLAHQVGIRAPTLIYHLDRLEAAGIVRRVRCPQNRRIQAVELTSAGDTLLLQLREAAALFDDRLRTGLDEAAVTALVKTLQELSGNAQVREPLR